MLSAGYATMRARIGCMLTRRVYFALVTMVFIRVQTTYSAWGKLWRAPFYAPVTLLYVLLEIDGTGARAVYSVVLYIGSNLAPSVVWDRYCLVWL